VTPRVAITRVSEDAARTVEAVRARGAEPVLAPLLTIIPCGYDTNVEGAQALVFTSANGVRAFPAVRDARNIPVLAVGDTTASAALAAGFLDVRSANGDVASLAALAKATLDPKRGKIVHIGGDHLAGDLGGELQRAGFKIDRRVAYAARAATELPAALREQVDVVLFHSARAAQTYVALGGAREGRAAGCISQAAADAAGAGWTHVIVAPAPREDALLDAVFRA